MTAIGMRALFATGAFVLAIAPGCGGACQGDTLVPEGPPDVVVRLDPPSLADELDTRVITVVTHLGVDSDRTPAGGAPPPSAATSDAIPAIAATPDANTPDPNDAPEGETPPDDVAASPLETTEPVAQATPPEAVPYVERFRAAYAARQIALSDVTTQIAAPEVGVYVEDLTVGGEAAGTPNRVWLSGADLQTVSPSVESLLVGRAGERVGGVPSFTCDPSRYACRTLPGAPIGAYYRFAALGPSRVVYLVGVLTWDPGAPSASVDQRIGVFDRIIDARLAPIR